MKKYNIACSILCLCIACRKQVDPNPYTDNLIKVQIINELDKSTIPGVSVYTLKYSEGHLGVAEEYKTDANGFFSISAGSIAITDYLFFCHSDYASGELVSVSSLKEQYPLKPYLPVTLIFDHPYAFGALVSGSFNENSFLIPPNLRAEKGLLHQAPDTLFLKIIPAYDDDTILVKHFIYQYGQVIRVP